MTATAAQHDQVRVAEERRNRYGRLTARAMGEGDIQEAYRFARLFAEADAVYHAVMTGAGVIQ